MNINLLPHKEFLRESNAIEDVWDEDSLQQALYAWDYVIQEPKLTPSVIKKTHKILMLHQTTVTPAEKGYFRMPDTRPGYDGRIFIGGREGKPWYAVPNLIEQWCANVNDVIDNGQYEPRELLENLTRDHHVAYEAIHPFVDGNGRTGRIFMNWQRVKLNLPILVIKEAEKFTYYKWFR